MKVIYFLSKVIKCEIFYSTLFGDISLSCDVQKLNILNFPVTCEGKLSKCY